MSARRQSDVQRVLDDLDSHEAAVYSGRGVRGPDVLSFVQRARAVVERLAVGVPLRTIDMVREFHEAFGVPVRLYPTTDITPEERMLRARLVFEEALEFVEAMGCVVRAECRVEMGEVVLSDEIGVYVDAHAEIDLIEAADALADLDYVVTGSALTMGIPHTDVVAEVHRSNMSKLDPATGQPILREGDGKVLKGSAYSPPDVRAVLHSWGAPDSMNGG